MKIHTSASALLKAFRTFGASVLMVTLVALSFPITALAQEAAPENPAPEVQETPTDEPEETQVPEEQEIVTEAIETQNFHQQKPHDEDEEDGAGSITVCKILIDENDAVVSGEGINATFTIPFLAETTSEGEYEADLADAVFTTELDLNDTILDASEGNDAECTTYSNLSAGHYYYGEEAISGPDADRVEVVGYSDYSGDIPAVADSLDDVGAYSGELFDANEGNDGDRNQERDGDINLGEGAHRTLVVVNRLNDEPAQPDTCVIVSDTTNQVDGNNAVPSQTPYNSAWNSVTSFFAGLGGGATWIWSSAAVQNPTQEETKIFTKNFSLTNEPTSATLEVSADNGYKVVVNTATLDDKLAVETNYSASHNYSVGNLDAGTNSLEFTVKNFAQGGGTPTSNPAGLIYKLTVTGASCGEPEEPEEPETPVNSCVAGDNEYAPEAAVPFGATPGGEKTLQQILTAEYGAGAPTAATEQDNYQEWEGTGNDVTFTVKNISEDGNSGHSHVFGYKVNGGAFVPVFRDGSVGAPHAGVDLVAFGASKEFTVEDVNTIVFVMGDWDGTDYDYYSTTNATNALGEAHAVSYNVSDDEYAIAFEDLSFAAGDEDYNDVVVSLHVDECSKGGVVCDPKVNLLQNGSFENPDVTNGAGWDVFEVGTSPTLVWLADFLGAASGGKVELHGGVNGWLASDDAQYTELDSDLNGPASPGGQAAVEISQAVATVPGQNYRVSFDFSARPGSAAAENAVEVRADGSLIGSYAAALPTAGNQTEWSAHSYDFEAGDASVLIALRDAGATNNSEGTFIDNVSVTCLPEEQEETGTLIIKKIAEGGDDTFEFSINPWAEDQETGYAEVTTTEGGGQTEEIDLLPGTYDISENVPEEWDLDGVKCVSSDEELTLKTVEGPADGQTISIDEGETVTCTFLNELKDDGEPEEGNAMIHVTKVMCKDESFLPNWGDGSYPNITETTVAGFLATVNAETEEGNPNCWLQPGWEFQTAPEGTGNPGNNVGVAGEPWSSVGFTDTFGELSFEVPEGELVWLREVFLGEGYVPFSGWLTGNEEDPLDAESEYSAELYCGEDVLHYDNYDYLANPEEGEHYYCAAFNALANNGGEEETDVCANVEGTQLSVPNGMHLEGDNQCVPDTTSRNRSGNHRGGGSSGIVAGASTSCMPLLTSYLHIGWNNDPSEVSKLQEFLNSHLGLSLPVTGFFGPATYDAVKAFQKQYWQGVLQPWFGRTDSAITSENTPTGFVYQTTRWQINNIWCPGSEAFPESLI